MEAEQSDLALNLSDPCEVRHCGEWVAARYLRSLRTHNGTIHQAVYHDRQGNPHLAIAYTAESIRPATGELPEAPPIPPDMIANAQKQMAAAPQEDWLERMLDPGQRPVVQREEVTVKRSAAPVVKKRRQVAEGQVSIF